MTVAEALEAARLFAPIDPENLPDVLDRLRALIAKLNGAGPLDTQAAQTEAVRLLAAAAVPDARRLVTAAFAERAAAAAAGAVPRAGISFAPPDPWPEPVAGDALLADLARIFANYVILPDGGATALALWTLHAHAHEAARVSPLLIITSPEKQCGKTTLLTVLRSLVPRPLPAANVSPAVVFRAIEKYHPTLLVDEADTFLDAREELRGILNAGHSREFATVLRAVGEDFEPRAFCVWAPKVLAAIGNLPDTLHDRAVILPLRRKAAHETTVEVSEAGMTELLTPFARQAQRWAADHLGALKVARPVMQGFVNRAKDNWAPLLAIADAAGERWPERARRAARLLVGSAEDQSAGTILLADLRTLFAERAVERLETALIVETLVGMIERPWPEWKQGRPLTPRQLARLLERFGIRPKVLRVAGGTARGYDRDDFADAFSRYLPPDASTLSAPPLPMRNSVTTQQRRGNLEIPIRNMDDDVTDTRTEKSPPTLECYAVTDPEGGRGPIPSDDLRVERLADGSHRVTGGTRPHIVTADRLSCDCEDHQYRRRTCKHLVVVQGAA